MPSVTSFATSKVRSEPSVISPYRPSPAEMRALRDELRQAQRTEDWVKNEIQLPAKTQRQIMAQMAAPAAPARSPAARTQPQAPNTATQQPKKPSALKRAVVGLAVLGGIVGTIGGLVSIVALGPVGLAIAGASFLIAVGATMSLRKYG